MRCRWWVERPSLPLTQPLTTLTAGGSASPAKLLAVLGVDLDDPEIWEDGFAVLEGFVERMC
jgi:oligoendopeptidase F